MADSPGNYQNNTNSWSRTASSFSLSGMSDCRAQYFLWLDTEQGFDGIIVEASTNALTWTQLAAWSGDSGGWIWQNEDMSAFDGQPSVYLRYRFVSDGSQTGDGAYIDDVAVRCVRATLLRQRVRLPPGHLDGDPARDRGRGAGVGASPWCESGPGEGRPAPGRRSEGRRWPARSQPAAG